MGLFNLGVIWCKGISKKECPFLFLPSCISATSFFLFFKYFCVQVLIDSKPSYKKKKKVLIDRPMTAGAASRKPENKIVLAC